MSKDTSGPAFPLPPIGNDNLPDWQGSGGLSLRDYFAAAALTGLVQRLSDQGMKYDASNAYACADRMLAERAK